jgi:hypothetical protein
MYRVGDNTYDEDDIEAMLDEAEHQLRSAHDIMSGMPVPSVDFSSSSSPSSSTPEGSPTDDNSWIPRGNSGRLPPSLSTSTNNQDGANAPEVIDLTFSPAKPTISPQPNRRRMQLPLPKLQPQLAQPPRLNMRGIK